MVVRKYQDLGDVPVARPIKFFGAFFNIIFMFELAAYFFVIILIFAIRISEKKFPN